MNATVHRFETLPSTNDAARDMAVDGAPEGTVVVAEVQTSGRGRLNRHWQSPPGNLYCSVVLRPDCEARRCAQLSFAAALAAAEAVAEIIPQSDVRLKWPNDVLAGGRKIAGLLLEAAPVAAAQIPWVVVGCGLNIGVHPEYRESPATSLAAEGAEAVAPDDVLAAFLERLDHWTATWRRLGFGPLRQAWLGRAHGMGTRVLTRVTGGGGPNGLFVDIDEEGGLVLDLGAGKRHTISGGAVYFGNTETHTFT